MDSANFSAVSATLVSREKIVALLIAMLAPINARVTVHALPLESALAMMVGKDMIAPLASAHFALLPRLPWLLERTGLQHHSW